MELNDTNLKALAKKGKLELHFSGDNFYNVYSPEGIKSSCEGYSDKDIGILKNQVVCVKIILPSCSKLILFSMEEFCSWIESLEDH